MTHVHCPECGFQNPEAANYCAKCGALLPHEDSGGHTTMTFPVEELADDDGAPLEELPVEGTALVVRAGGGRQGETFPLDGDRIEIGRSPQAVVFLDDVTVSRTHAVLTRDAAGYSIEDSDSPERHLREPAPRREGDPRERRRGADRQVPAHLPGSLMATVSPESKERRLTIGAMRERLSDEFPDISISKIRYLEGQGLLAPRRTRSGYRLYSDEDVERLRTILRLQRDEFLPLRVIRDELASPGAKRRSRRRSADALLTMREPSIDLRTLCQRSGAEAAFVRELEEYGILEPLDEDGEPRYPGARRRRRRSLHAPRALRDRAEEPAKHPKRRLVRGGPPGADRLAGSPFAEPGAPPRGARRPRGPRLGLAGALAAPLLARPSVARLGAFRGPVRPSSASAPRIGA